MKKLPSPGQLFCCPLCFSGIHLPLPHVLTAIAVSQSRLHESAIWFLYTHDESGY